MTACGSPSQTRRARPTLCGRWGRRGGPTVRRLLAEHRDREGTVDGGPALVVLADHDVARAPAPEVDGEERMGGIRRVAEVGVDPDEAATDVLRRGDARAA